MTKSNIKARENIPEKYKWDISKIYKNHYDWEVDLSKLTNNIETLNKYKQSILEEDNLLNYFKDSEKLLRLRDKLFMFAYLIECENKSNPLSEKMLSQISVSSTKLEECITQITKKIQSYSKDNVDKKVEQCKELSLYKHHIHKIFENKKHSLSLDQELILTSINNTLDSFKNIYNTLVDSELEFCSITDDKNNIIDVSEANYQLLIKDENRDVRQKAFNSLHSGYNNFKGTLGQLLLSKFKSMSILAKLRGFTSTLESQLEPEKIPLEVYDNIVSGVSNNISLFHEYCNLKKEVLDLEELRLCDINLPVVKHQNSSYSFEDAVDIIKKGLAILGDEYLSLIDTAIDNRWVDVYPNKNKKSGAYSEGCYDTMPYIVLNYTNTLNDVFILTHELGHSIHSHYSRTCQPYVYSQYTMFCAEIASMTNEILLMHYLIESSTDKNYKAYLINHQLEQFKSIVFRQTMFAEFEKNIYEKVDNNEGVSTQDLCDNWLSLTKKYFGNNVTIDSLINVEWARIPHFYENFYVYQYVTGFAIANVFAQSIINKEEGALENYITFLKSGSKAYSVDILSECGIDITSENLINAVITQFETLLAGLKNLIINEKRH